MKVEGYASLFGVEDSGGDVVEYGAVRVPQGCTSIPMLHHHEASLPIGTWDRWSFDMTGFKVWGEITSATQEGREVQRLIQGGIVRGLSIGYETHKSTKNNGKRHLHEIELVEISLTCIPLLKQARLTGWETKLLSFAHLRGKLSI